MKLTNDEKFLASCALMRGDHFTRSNVLLCMLLPGEYCVQKMDGAPSSKNRVITHDWNEALSSFEAFCD